MAEGKVKSKGKGKLNSVERSNWQEAWLDGWNFTTSIANKITDHVDQGWWKTTDEQTRSSSGWWMDGDTSQTAWEPEEPLGGFRDQQR